MKGIEFSKGGSAYISSKIEESIKDQSRTVTISGNWEISEAIRLPSNFTLILKDAHLRMADGVYSNMFVNEHHGTDVGNTVEGTDRNISIIGRGSAILDGGKYNGLSEKNHSKDGLPPIWKNNLLLFTNVDGFKVSGIACRNQRWWALNFIFCRNGYIGNLDFCACDIAIDENGNEYRGLIREKYSEVLVKNADGIDLRQGCHHILIENVTGFTEDDTVALTALDWKIEETFAVKGLPSDICHVEIRNIRSAAFCANVRLLNQSGIKLHDVVVDGVYDMGIESEHMNRSACAVRIGDTHFYGTRHATEDETYNITIKNVCGSGDYVIALAGAVKDLVLFGIESKGGAKMLKDDRNV